MKSCIAVSVISNLVATYIAEDDHQYDDQISIGWQSNLCPHCFICNISLIHFFNLQSCGSETNKDQSRAVILSHTTLCQATILYLSYSFLLNPYKNFSHLKKNLIPTFHLYQRTNSFWCHSKTTDRMASSFVPPLPHPASFLLVHQLVDCWDITTFVHFLDSSQSSFCILVTPDTTNNSQESKLLQESRLADFIHLIFKTKQCDLASRSAASTAQVYIYIYNSKKTNWQLRLPPCFTWCWCPITHTIPSLF